MFAVSDGRAIQFGTVALLTGVAVFFTVRTWGIGERLETRPAAEIGEKDLASVQILSTGQVVGLRRNGSKTQVWIWGVDDAKLKNQRTFDIPSSEGEAPEKVPVAISPDGSRIAWPTPGSVRVEELAGASPARGVIRLERSRPLAGLAFADAGRLALLYRDGQLELRDVKNKTILASEKTGVNKPGSLLLFESKLAVFSPTTGDTYTFDSSRLSLVENKRMTPPLIAVALSGSGRIAALTERGVIQNDILCAAPGAVKALTFDEDGRLLAGGEFEGIHILASNQSPVRIAAAPPGTATLAAGGGHIVFGGASGATLLVAQTVSGINAVGIAAPAAWGLFVLAGLVWLASGRRAAQEQPTSQERVLAHAEAPEIGALTPPDGLLSACRAGQCVLFAGSGLAAQAGLPTWEQLLRRLVYWAAEQDVVTLEVRAACLSALDRGQSAVAADKIAAAFVGRERMLNRYLRTIFLSGHALSNAHDLLKELGFAGVITSNFDALVDLTFPYSVGSAYTAFDGEALQAVDPSRDFFLLRLCGSLDRPETILFSPVQYAAALAQNTACTTFIGKTLASRCLLFVGASLDGIENSLRGIVLDETPGRRHYALVDVHGEPWKARAATLEHRYGIAVIPFVPSDTNYPEVVKFLESLRDRIGTQVGARLDRTLFRESLPVPEPAVTVPAAAAPESTSRMQLCPVCGACYDEEVTRCPVDSAATEASLPIERTIEGRHRLERLLGRGGMGAVFEATDLRLHRRVAIKVVLSDVFRHANALQRFEREAKSAAKLNHPNIISIYDYGVIGSRGAYMVMELLDGVTWRKELERVKRVPPPTACHWADQLLEGVREAHSAGILHRDLKPENVFLTPTPKGAFRVKILDFGLAKAKILSLSGEERLTRADAAVGTFGYMPPEQLAGGRADESSDLYSIGIMMIEALTGLDIFEIPSHRDSLPTTFRDLFGTKFAREDVDGLSAVLERSVATVPRTRYRSAAELQEDLIGVLRRFPLAD
jgi:hypothetical protein